MALYRSHFLAGQRDDNLRHVYSWTADVEASKIDTFDALRPHQLAGSGRHFAITTVHGRVYMWGNGKNGQLGLGDTNSSTTPALVDSLKDISIISTSCAAAQTAAITSDGHLYVWGTMGNSAPVLLPSLVTKIQLKVLKVSLGAYHIMALVDCPKENGTVYTWGLNDKGQLGNGSTVAVENPIVIETLKGQYVVEICASETASGVLTNTGKVWVWGNNHDGISLGLNQKEEIVTKPTRLVSLNEKTITKIDFGTSFGAALTMDGNMYTWGNNSSGQLGLSDRTSRSKPSIVKALSEETVLGFSCGNRSVIAWTDEGNVYSWGSNTRNELGLPNIKDIPFLTLPKKLGCFPRSSIIFHGTCGSSSLAIIGIAKINVTYQDKRYDEVVVDSKTVGELKASLAKEWSMDPKSFVLQDQNNQLLSRHEKLREIILKRRNRLQLVLKKDVTVDDQEDVIFLFDEDDVPNVKLASIPQLLKWLIHARYPVRITSLISCSPTKQRIIEVLRDWLIHHQADFFCSSGDSSQLLTLLNEFIVNVIAPEDRALSVELTLLFHQMDPSKNIRARSVHSIPPTLKRHGTGDITIFSYPPEEMARQISLVAFQHFSAIEAKELICLGWMKADKTKRAPHIIKMIYYSNRISNWVCDTIINQSSTKRKIRAYERFVKICVQCMKLNNYNSLMDIAGGLQSSQLLKQTKTWPNFTADSNEYVAIADNITKMMIVNNKAGLRDNIRKAVPPGVPFLGMFLQDLVYIGDGNKDEINDLINFRKCSLIAQTIKEIQRFQHVPYELHSVEEIQNFLSLEDEKSQTVLQQGLESAEAQIVFLNQTSMFLIDRNTSYDPELQGERSSMWIQWCDKIEQNNTKYAPTDFATCPRSFLDIILESKAIENSIYSVLTAYPRTDFEESLFKRLLHLIMIPEVDIDVIVQLMKNSLTLNLSSSLRMIMTRVFCTFKNILPVQVRYPDIAKIVVEDNDMSEDISVVMGKRKKCNRAAVKLCQAATLLASSTDRMQVFSLLYRGLSLDHVEEVKASFRVQEEILLAEVEKLKAQRGTIPEGNYENEQIELNQKREDVEETVVQLKQRLEEITNEEAYFQTELNMKSQARQEYFQNLSRNLDSTAKRLERLNDVENLLLHITSMTESRDDQGRNVQTITTSLLRLVDFLEKQEKSLKALELKMDTIKTDILVMGSRYGMTVTQALSVDYEKIKQCFAATLNHLDFAFSTLEELSSTSITLNSKRISEQLAMAIQLKENIEKIRNSILDKHIGKQ